MIKTTGLDKTLLDDPENPEWKRLEFWVEDLVTDRSMRRRGIAKTILAACVFEAERQCDVGIPFSIVGSCKQSLVPFYEHLGCRRRVNVSSIGKAVPMELSVGDEIKAKAKA